MRLQLIEVEFGDIVEKHVGRVWGALTVSEKYLTFCSSEVVENFKDNYGDDYIVPSRSFFHKYCCPCVRNPSMQSCVDITTSTMEHYMRALAKYIRNNRALRNGLTNSTWLPLLSQPADVFIASTCCNSVPHPILACGIGSHRRIPSFVRWKCINGECNECGVELKHNISGCTALTQCTTDIEVLEWQHIARKGMSGGKQNTQLELTKTHLPVNVIFAEYD